MHTFQQSGLGHPPYVVVHPKQHALEKGQIFWCEHCGTTIKNRHFIQSSEGKVSIVGIDCLKKTGDEGLIDGVKRLKREAKARDRAKQCENQRVERLETERSQNGGHTNAELAAAIDADIEARIKAFIIATEDHAVLKSLTKIGFEQSMSHNVYLVTPYTPGQLAVIKKIHTKKRSRARANSKAYNESFSVCSAEVDDLQANIVGEHTVLEKLRGQSRHLKFG
ncbi:hypothetical protein [Teredinibacter purpureus]|uniref:hypothetical protein n=1 Tax=Teredinibacter purpureus TaxID=2731756 RepID=UPI0005F78ACD|nr:hypothetical protein [Teredinibacter purpureus]